MSDFLFVCFYFWLSIAHRSNCSEHTSVQAVRWIESNRLSTKIQLLVVFYFFFFFLVSIFSSLRDTFSLNLRRQLIDSSFHSFWSMHKSIKNRGEKKTSERFPTRLWIERSIVNHLNGHTHVCVCVCLSYIHLFISGQNSLLPWRINFIAAASGTL